MEAQFDEDIKGPGRGRHEAESRGPVTDDGLAGLIFKQLPARGNVLAEARGVQTVQPVVHHAMAGDFMAGLGDLPGQSGMPGRHMAEDEKSAPNLMPI